MKNSFLGKQHLKAVIERSPNAIFREFWRIAFYLLENLKSSKRGSCFLLRKASQFTLGQISRILQTKLYGLLIDTKVAKRHQCYVPAQNLRLHVFFNIRSVYPAVNPACVFAATALPSLHFICVSNRALDSCELLSLWIS